jgi:glutaredoxin
MSGPSPTIVLYTKPGCGLCDEARETLDALLAERRSTGQATAPIEERDILTNPDWERAFAFEIPVVEVGDRRLILAISPARLRRLLAEALDGAPATT